jgi:hypothetical protein
MPTLSPGAQLRAVSVLTESSFPQYLEYGLRNLPGEVGRDGISNLDILLGPVSLEQIIVRKCLKSRRFSDGETAALQRIRVNEVVPVL